MLKFFQFLTLPVYSFPFNIVETYCFKQILEGWAVKIAILWLDLTRKQNQSLLQTSFEDRKVKFLDQSRIIE